MMPVRPRNGGEASGASSSWRGKGVVTDSFGGAEVARGAVLVRDERREEIRGVRVEVREKMGGVGRKAMLEC